MAHTSFGGIGIALFFGINPILGALAFGIGAALVLGHIRYHYKQHDDTLIGALWAVGMAIGLLAIHYTKGYVSDVFSYIVKMPPY